MAREAGGELIEADDAVPRLEAAGDLRRRGLRPAGDHRHRGLGGIVAVLHAGGLGLLPGFQGGGHGPVDLHMAQDGLQLLQGQSAGAQEPGGLAGEVQDGGFHAHGAWAAVHDAVNATVHVLPDVLGAGAAGAAGAVGAGSRHGHPRLPEEGQGHGVVRAAHAHGVQPRRGDIRHDGLAPEDHGEGAGPEAPGQLIGDGGHILTAAAEPLGGGDVEDQGVILGTALGLEDLSHGGGVQAVGAQAVDRLRGEGQKAAGAEDGRRLGHDPLRLVAGAAGVPQVKILCFHCLRLVSSAGKRPGGQSLSRPWASSLAAVSAAARASMMGSRPPSSTAGSWWRVRPMRWSVTRPWG